MRIELGPNKYYIIALGVLLVVAWGMHDFVLVKNKQFQTVDFYSFEEKSGRDVAASMTTESIRVLHVGNEREQILGIVHIMERNRFLLYKKEISTQSYYDFLDNFLYPLQKRHLKKKDQYAYQVNKYLRRLRRTKYTYFKYEMSEPEFYYEDYTRNARVSLLRSGSGSNEFYRYHFRKYKGKYFLYLK